MSWVGRNLKDHPVPTPCHGQVCHLPDQVLDQIAQAPIQPSLIHLQGQGIISHPWVRWVFGKEPSVTSKVPMLTMAQLSCFFRSPSLQWGFLLLLAAIQLGCQIFFLSLHVLGLILISCALTWLGSSIETTHIDSIPAEPRCGFYYFLSLPYFCSAALEEFIPAQRSPISFLTSNLPFSYFYPLVSL